MSMMRPRRLIIGLAMAAVMSLPLVAASCSRENRAPDEAAAASDAISYSFRAGERPIYEKVIAPADLQAFMDKGGLVLDVRLEEDFAADPAIVPGTVRRDPDRIAEWAEEFPKDRPVAVYCVKGKWVSQKAAAYLADRGIDAYSVEGGLAAWKLHSASR